MDVNLEETTHFAHFVLLIFLVGYSAIVIEELIKLNKAAIALLMAVGCWTILFLEPADSVTRHLYILTFQMFKVSQVVFFLIGALTIVEIINAHKGFQVIIKRLIMRSKRKLLWTTGLMTFFLSSVLDNLTTTIVMVSLINKLLNDREERLMLGGAIVIAANAGGTWTPIGDVSTTLLWIYGQVTSFAILYNLFFPSIIGVAASLLWIGYKFKGEINNDDEEIRSIRSIKIEPGGTLVLIIGICSLIFVPFFKLLTNLPPFMGMMFGLGVMWVVTDVLHYKFKERHHLQVVSILPKVDISVILFYLGILLSINSLESAGLLKKLSEWFNLHISSPNFIPVLIGLASSVLDNVSLVAATIGMYGLEPFHTDSFFWLAVAYCAGTGGSILIIGSAAGVALMAIEKATFMWYAKKMTFPALITFFVGLVSYFLLNQLTASLLV